MSRTISRKKHTKLDNEDELRYLVWVRAAKEKDKSSVLAFCKNTFSWGDYIGDVWDKWLSNGTLYLLEADRLPVGIYNIVFFEKEVWIEGMRVHPQYRRRGFGRMMLKHAESMVQNKAIRLIIESENIPSVRLVQSMGYVLEERWRLYGMIPFEQSSNAVVAKSHDHLINSRLTFTYADSWRWLPLDGEALDKLICQKRVLISDNDAKIFACGVWNRSDDFSQVFQLCFVKEMSEGTVQILKWVQNKAYDLGCKRIQVFASGDLLPQTDLLERKSLFYLMRKDAGKKNL